ncbi:MAG: sigma-70 family RNA polymerase sigma factor [Ignavibacteriales bacterium]|nr:sigma-70 family RNA polymerase sigma factor [Ignavibacteriales bacterium]
MGKLVSTFNAAESALVRSAQSGDQRAFAELVRKHEDLVYRFAYKLCRNQEKAEETFQDTFVNVYRKLKQFDGKSKFSTWLYKIVVNNCLMKHRVRKIDQASISIHAPEGFVDTPPHDAEGHPLQTVASWKDSPLDGVMNKELRHLLDSAIAKLPSDYRVVFVLRDVEGQSAEETAKILGLTVPAVKSRLHRARAFLREQLNEYMTE